MTKVIACLSQKGGPGKSTVARIAAVAYASAGWDTLILDADTAQETSNHWFARRMENEKADKSFLWADRCRGANPLKNALEKHDPHMVVIDGAPHATDATVQFASQADLILIPTGTAVDDLMPALRLAQALCAAHGINQERIRFVLNHCSRNNRERCQAIEAILAAGFKALGAFLNESPCYRSGMDIGLAPQEVPYAIPRNRAIHLAESISDALRATEEIQ